MNYDLISEAEYEALPLDDPERCFLEFEKIVRRNMTKMIDENTSHDFDQAVREQYMTMVASVAVECNVPNIKYKSNNNFWEGFSQFSLAVQGEVARIRIRGLGRQRPYSVMLTSNTRTTIEHYISRLREMVQSSDLDDIRKNRIDEKLDQLVAELKTPRMSFGKSMAILAAVLATMGSAVTIAAEGRQAVAQIVRLIGEDKETEDSAAQRLASPPKALPDLSKPLEQSRTQKQILQPPPIDDEIPF